MNFLIKIDDYDDFSKITTWIGVQWGELLLINFFITVIIVSMMAGAANAENLAVIKWKHAVNSWDLLNDALQSK